MTEKNEKNKPDPIVIQIGPVQLINCGEHWHLADSKGEIASGALALNGDCIISPRFFAELLALTYELHKTCQSPVDPRPIVGFGAGTKNQQN